MQAVPLGEEHVLAEHVVGDGIGEQRLVLLDGLGLAVADVLIRPLHPGDQIEVLLDGVEEREVVHPALLRLKGGQLGRDALAGICEGLLQQAGVLLLDGGEVHLVQDGQRLVGALGQQTVLNHQIEVDHQRVAGVGGRALVGGLGVAGGAHGQHLPDVHAG